MLFELPSQRTLAEIDTRLRDSAAAHRFGVLAVHDLQATMRSKGVDCAKACLVYEVCNPHQAKRVLEANGAVSTALPCRISVYEENGGYRIATLLPTELMKLFGGAELEAVAQEVEVVMMQMVRDAA